MNDSKIPVRYSKALLELAEEKKLTEKIYKDIIYIQDLVQLTEIKEMLQSPVILSSKKNKIFKSILLKDVDELTIQFINMVFQNKREVYLEDIARNFIQVYKEKKNIKTVELTTAVKINTDIKEAFRKQVLKTFKANIEMETKIDPDLIGGFVVKVDDILYDASVKRQLRNIQNTLLKEKL